MATVRTIQVSDYFSDFQLKLASKCENVTEICEKVVKPHLAEINRINGQENDPKYWAYALQYVLSQVKH